MKIAVTLLAFLLVICANLRAQIQELHNLGTVTISGLNGAVIGGSARCDDDGKLYLQTHANGEPWGKFSIVRVTADGRIDATWTLDSVPEPAGLHLSDFQVSHDGEVIAFAAGKKELYLLRFDKDGHFKSALTLDSLFVPARIALFNDGSFLAAGLENPTRERRAAHVPFTALFDGSGRLQKKIALPDDAGLTAAADRGDSTAVADGNPMHQALSVAWGSATSGLDGNIYLMRRAAPAIIHAISPTGEVVRSLTIYPPQPGMLPESIQSTKDGLVVLFAADREASVVVADPETGEALRTYEIPTEVGLTLACHANNVFTFLGQPAGKRALTTLGR